MFKLNDNKKWPVITGLEYKIRQDYADAYNYLVSNMDDLNVVTDIITKEDMVANFVPTSLSALIRKGIDKGGASIFLITSKNISDYIMDMLKEADDAKDLPKVALPLNRMFLKNDKGPNIIEDVTALSDFEYTSKVLYNFLDSIKNYVNYTIGDSSDCYDLVVYNQHILRKFYDVLSIPVAFKVKLSRTPENIWEINIELPIINILLSKQIRKREYIIENYTIANNNIENLKLKFKNVKKYNPYLYEQVHGLVKPLENIEPPAINLYGEQPISPFTSLPQSVRRVECSSIAAALSVDIIVADSTSVVTDKVVLSTDSVYAENVLYSILCAFKDVINSKYLDIIREGIYVGDRDLSFIHHLMSYKQYIKSINRQPLRFQDALERIYACTEDIFEDMYIDKEAVDIMKENRRSEDE